MMNNDEPVSIADRAGITTASACAIHCLVAPWLGSVTPLLGATETDDATEIAFLAASLAISGAALLVASLRAHRQWRAIAMYLVGAAVLIGARVTGLAEPTVGQCSS